MAVTTLKSMKRIAIISAFVLSFASNILADGLNVGTLSAACASGVGCAANSTLAVSLSGWNSASFTLPTGNNLSATLVADTSSDGGVTWQAANLRVLPSTTWVATAVVNSTAGTVNIQLPGGASQARVRVSAFTSGAANLVQITSVFQPEQVETTTATISGSVTVGSITNPVTITPANASPCYANARTTFVINNLSSNTLIVAGSASKKIYVCEYYIAPVAAAANVELVEGTGATCGSGTAGIQGGATAATGANLAINGGFVQPYTGDDWGSTATAGDSLCIYPSAAVDGILKYVGPL